MQTITIYVKGDFALTLPTEWIVIGGAYDPNGTQFIVQSWDDGNFYCAIGGGEIDLSNYLQKSGGNITGDLNVSGNVGIGTTNPDFKTEILYSTSFPNNTPSSPNAWNAPGKSTLSLKADNNRIAIGLDNVENSRKGFIQVGHTSSPFANLNDPELLLQPFGGNVVMVSLPIFADNTDASSLAVGTIYRTSDGDLKIKF